MKDGAVFARDPGRGLAARHTYGINRPLWWGRSWPWGGGPREGKPVLTVGKGSKSSALLGSPERVPCSIWVPTSVKSLERI